MSEPRRLPRQYTSKNFTIVEDKSFGDYTINRTPSKAQVAAGLGTGQEEENSSGLDFLGMTRAVVRRGEDGKEFDVHLHHLHSGRLLGGSDNTILGVERLTGTDPGQTDYVNIRRENADLINPGAREEVVLAGIAAIQTNCNDQLFLNGMQPGEFQLVGPIVENTAPSAEQIKARIGHYVDEDGIHHDTQPNMKLQKYLYKDQDGNALTARVHFVQRDDGFHVFGVERVDPLHPERAGTYTRVETQGRTLEGALGEAIKKLEKEKAKTIGMNSPALPDQVAAAVPEGVVAMLRHTLTQPDAVASNPLPGMGKPRGIA